MACSTDQIKPSEVENPRGVQFTAHITANGQGFALKGRPNLVAIFHPICGIDHAGIAVLKSHRALGRATHLFEIRQPLFNGPDIGVELFGFGQFINGLHGDAVVCIPWPGPVPAQPLDMTETAQNLTQIARNGADIAALPQTISRIT